MAYPEDDIHFECARPIEAHARLVMEWRNDPVTLSMSYHRNPKRWPAFFQEFCKDYFIFPELPPLFVQFEGQRVAFLLFQPVQHPENLSRRCCDISINVAPNWRHRGLGHKILEQSKAWAAQQGYEDLYAEVKKANAISLKVFLRAGFHLIGETEKVIFDTGEVCPIYQFLAPLSPSNEHIRKNAYIIAEAGSNWRAGQPKEDVAMAKALIAAAAQAGADAIKFQVFRPETIYVSNAGSSDYLSQAGIKEDIQNLFADLSMPYEMIAKLSEECTRHGISFMATAFSIDDFEAVDPFVSMHKIASYEIGHIRLLEKAALSKKPLIVSTGAACDEEIAWSVNYLRSLHCGPLTLMQCTACYPATPESMNLRTIPWLQMRFKVPCGLSDHSRHPIYAPVAAVALGAKIIEKHFTLDNCLPGPDHAFAVTPEELKAMVAAIRQTEKMLGSSVKSIDPTEMELRSFARRGIQAIKEIRRGDAFEEDVNIAILRPGKQSLGIHPKFLNEVLGKKSQRTIPLGSGIQFGDWENHGH